MNSDRLNMASHLQLLPIVLAALSTFNFDTSCVARATSLHFANLLHSVKSPFRPVRSLVAAHRDVRKEINPQAEVEDIRDVFIRNLNPNALNPDKNVVFSLYTRQNPDTSQPLAPRDPSLLRNSFFDPRKPTKIITHGWHSNQRPGSGGPALKDAFLAMEDANVVLVDWSKGDVQLYSTAVPLTQLVGQHVAKLIAQMEEAGMRADGLHLMGHSLGSHISGAAGRAAGLGTRGVGRITGLDPAGPSFSAEKDPELSLDPTDAGFVDVIHTNGGQLGQAAPTGHVDFYPNGGMHVQPGCGRDTFGLCSHCFAYGVLLQALKNPVSLLGTKCTSWEDFAAGTCNGNQQLVMGIHTDHRARGNFYMDTTNVVSPRPLGLDSFSMADTFYRDLTGALSGGSRQTSPWEGLSGAQSLQC